MALKIFEASRRLAAITAQFTAAGLDIEQFLAAADDTALKAHLDSLKPAAAPAVDLAAVGATAVKPYAEAFQKFGVTVKATDEAAGITAADIEQSLRARASILAQEQLAKHGLPAPLALTPAGDPTKAKQEKVMSMEEFRQLPHASRSKFFREGGRLDSAA